MKLLFKRKSDSSQNLQVQIQVENLPRRLTDHEERCGQIQADEVDTQVYAEAKRRNRGHRRRNVPEETQPRLAAHPVGHHARHHGEQSHEDERAREIRHYGLRVLLQFQFQCPRGESGGGDVLEHVLFLHFPQRFEKRFLPGCSAVRDNAKLNYYLTDNEILC